MLTKTNMTVHNTNLSLSTFNMFGFRIAVGMLTELCDKFKVSINAVQEHWLRSDNLDKFNHVHSDYNFFAISSMCIAASEGILKGRPFGGVAFLWHKSLNRCFKFVQSYPNGRCLVSLSNVITNLY